MVYISYLWIVPFLTLSVITGLCLFVYILIRRRNSAAFFSFMLAVLFLLTWNCCQFYELLNGKQIKGPIYYLEYTVVVFSGVLWLIVCLQFIKSNVLKKCRSIILLLLPPLFFYVCFLTNQFHHLFFYSTGHNIREYGIAFLFHSVVSYTYVVIGIVAMLRYSIKNIPQIKFQAFLLTIAFLFVVLTTAIRVTGLIRFDVLVGGKVRENYDISAVFVLGTFTLLLFIIIRYRFLSIRPVAYKEILKNMNESVLVIDNRNKIFIKNNSFDINFERLLLEHKSPDVKALSRLIDTITEESDEKDKIVEALRHPLDRSVSGEIRFKDSNKTFNVNIRPIFIHSEYNGKIISLNDISEYKNLLVDLDFKNAELTELNGELSALNEDLVSANTKLMELASKEKELAVTRERNRFARDVHDTLGHSMTILLKLLEASALTIDDDPMKVKDILSKAMDTAKEGLSEIKLSLAGLINEKLCGEGLVGVLERLISEFQVTGMNMDFSIDEELKDYKSENTDVLYRICQEALTNAYRHGRATEVNFVLKHQKDRIIIYIFDNGSGCSEIKKGMGLTGMEQRIRELNGKVFFSSGNKSGFSIRVELPVI